MTESYFARYAMSSKSMTSLMATSSTFGLSRTARKMFRPMRPKPLSATRTTSDSSTFSPALR
ncbi:hypothetical protein D320_12555 [Haloferax sp. BAB-2207]|nr:hypothetical protein D320_12555 [Haloferax sp. BAB-2207]